MDRQQLIKAIQTFSQKTGLSPATITGKAVGNSRLYQRLIFGGDCTTEVARRVIAFINTHEGRGAA